MTDTALKEAQTIKSWVDEAHKQKKILVLLIAGDSASGKSKRTEKFKQSLNLHKLITATTRPIRPGEVTGRDYYFMTSKDFGYQEFIDKTTYSLYQYGLTKTELDRAISHNQDSFIILDLSGILNMKNELDINYHDKVLTKTIYYSINKNTFEERIRAREPNVSQQQLNARAFENEQAHTQIKKNPKLFNLLINADEKIKEFEK